MNTDVFEDLEQTSKVVTEDEDVLIYKYAKSIISCQMEVKSIQDDIKEIKSEARGEGVLVKEIDAAISTLKKEAKMMPQEAKIAEEILEKLRANKDIADSISMIV